jgi:PAS domain S-box-containing protein
VPADDLIRVTGSEAAVKSDVTRRVEAAKLVSNPETRFRDALDGVGLHAAILDPDGRVLFANRYFLDKTGWTLEELVGSDGFALLAVEDHPDESRDGYRAGVAAGLVFEKIENSWRTRSGGFVRIAWTNNALRDDAGRIVGVVSVGEDVTVHREVEASLALSTRGRVAFAHALAGLRQRDTPEETGRDITDAVVELPGIDMALLLTFEEFGGVRVVAVTAPAGAPVVAGTMLQASRATYLRTRAAEGAWAEGWVPRDADGEYGNALQELGLRGVAYAPIGDGDACIGLVVLGVADMAVAAHIVDQLPVAVEFAAAARSLVGGPLAARTEFRASRRRIDAIIQTNAFEPVFQPIVEMSTGVAVGFEALTRFRDGAKPDVRFAEAGRADVGLDLESATLEAILAASQLLRAGCWLSLNVSGAFILAGDRLARILVRRTRPVVLEITEHDVIPDYPAIRQAVASLGPDVSLAVDDAGAGVANFAHIVELRPAFVKIDIGLVRGLNQDLTRQALIVGLHHFAKATHCWLIAEGVETEEERRALLGLGLELGQGFLFGRPAPAATWSVPVLPAASGAHRPPRSRVRRAVSAAN